MPRALARSAYGTSRRIGEAGVSVARLESLTLLNAIPLTFDTQRANLNPSTLGKTSTEYTRASRSSKRWRSGLESRGQHLRGQADLRSSGSVAGARIHPAGSIDVFMLSSS